MTPPTSGSCDLVYPSLTECDSPIEQILPSLSASKSYVVCMIVIVPRAYKEKRGHVTTTFHITKWTEGGCLKIDKNLLHVHFMHRML